MCVIVFKPRGRLFNEDDLYKCFNKNGDGAGIMYRLKDKIVITKGLMTFYELMDELDVIDELYDIKSLSMTLHFRYGTQGTNNEENTHPFPLTTDIRQLKQKYIETDTGIAHNGVIGRCDRDRYNKDLSDTQLFIKDYMVKMNLNSAKIRSLIGEITGSKFVIMTARNTYKIGSYTKIDGVYYSNTFWNYKAKKKTIEQQKYDKLYATCDKCNRCDCENCEIFYEYGNYIDEYDEDDGFRHIERSSMSEAEILKEINTLWKK